MTDYVNDALPALIACGEVSHKGLTEEDLSHNLRFAQEKLHAARRLHDAAPSGETWHDVRYWSHVEQLCLAAFQSANQPHM